MGHFLAADVEARAVSFNCHLNLGHYIEQTGGAYPLGMYANSLPYHREENEFSD